jgi:focal adhesion kinase 2
MFKAQNQPLREIDAHSLQLTQVLGKGASSSVAEYLLEGQKVAVKVFKMNTYRVDYDAMYEDELKNLRSLDHPHVIKLVGVLSGSRYKGLILELASRGTLNEYLQKNEGPSRDHQLLDRANLQVATGLVYLHSLRIIHKDIKSGNIVFDEQMNAKIIDLGLSVRLPEGKDVYTSGFTEGSFYWGAPEMNKRRFTTAFDIYSWAITYFETQMEMNQEYGLGAGKPQVDDKDQKNIPAMPSRMSDETRVMLLKCWNLKPELRPKATEIVEILEKEALKSVI